MSLAYLHTRGQLPTVIFLPGYLSDMQGSKALALETWAKARGQAFLRFDYRACGRSTGDFETASLADWRDDAVSMIDMVEGPVLLVGSSMGGWIMLLAALARPKRIAGLIGIAAAPDFTDWGFSEEEKLTILSEGRLEQGSNYGYDKVVTTKAFWQSGEAARVMAGEIAIDCPVRLLHGQRDPEVSWQRSLALAEKLRSADVQVNLIKDGDHRLSRAGDIAILTRTLDEMLESL